MTSQGSPTTVLRRAIRGGNLKAVEIALVDVAHLDLQDALEILALMARDGDERYWRWSERWTQRASAEERGRLEELLARLPDEAALLELRGRAERLRGLHPSARLHVPPRKV